MSRFMGRRWNRWNRWLFSNMLHVQSSPALLCVVWREVTNEILSAQLYFNPAIHVSGVICPGCLRSFFWRLYSFIPLHLILPVMTAALLSPSFHAGWVQQGWVVCGSVDDWYRWPSGSGTPWSNEGEVSRNDVINKIGDEKRPMHRKCYLSQEFMIYFLFSCCCTNNLAMVQGYEE